VKAPFLYNPESRLWVSYEDEQSIRAKAKYVVDRGLGGIMFWQYTEDAGGRLLSAIDKGLR
jgi:chitinase